MKKNNKRRSIFENFFNNPNILFGFMTLIIICLLGACIVISKTKELYVFNGGNDDITIYNGIVDINTDINYFKGGTVIYTGKKVTLQSYKMGYYICGSKKDKSISTLSNSSEEGFDLENLLTTNDFSLMEPHKNSNNLSKDSINKLDKLCFKVSGTDLKGEEYSLKIKFEVQKVSK